MPKKKPVAENISPEILILRQGINGQFWQTLKKMLQQDIDVITEEILENDGLSEAPKPMTVRDIARIERKKMLWLLNYPEDKIAASELKSIENDPDDE
jgi:hypothetical protein